MLLVQLHIKKVKKTLTKLQLKICIIYLKKILFIKGKNKIKELKKITKQKFNDYI